MTLRIRDARLSDHEALCALFAEENRFHVDLVPGYIQRTSNVLTREELEDFLACPTASLLVAEDAGAVLGALMVSVQASPTERWKCARRVGYVEDLVVTAGARGQGIGTRFMEAARDWTLSQGIQTLELHVWEANVGARRFYESLGLTSVRRRMGWRLET